MAKHVALLRAINVGGRNKLPMAALVAHFEAAGCREVSTYIQSGNVIYSATAALAKRIPTVIAASIAKRHGFGAPVITRAAAELPSIITANPFLPGAPVDELYVMFLAAAPDAAAIARLDPKRSPPDEFAVRGAELYLWFPKGAGQTKLTNAYIDKQLGTIGTTRNWNTTLALARLAA